MGLRRGVWVGVGFACGCFSNAPEIDDGTATGTMDTTATTATTPTATAPESSGVADTSAGTSASSTESPTGTTDPQGWCATPMPIATSVHQPGGSETIFERIARIDDALWVVGRHRFAAQLNPSAWSIDQDAAVGPLVGLELGQDFARVDLVLGPGGPPLAIANEGVQAPIGGHVLDNPVDGTFGLVGQWSDGTGGGFGQVVRDAAGTLFAAAFVLNDGGVAYWVTLESVDGVDWSAGALNYAMHPSFDSRPNAIATDAGHVVVAGVGRDNLGAEYWVTFVYEKDGTVGEPDDSLPGVANVVFLVGQDVFVGGAKPQGGGAIRRAPLSAEAAFDEIAAFDSPVVDVALGPQGVLLALTSGRDDAPWELWACDDLMAGDACWRNLSDGVVEVDGIVRAHDLFVDGEDDLWVVGDRRDMPGGVPGGVAYRIGCAP